MKKLQIKLKHLVLVPVFCLWLAGLIWPFLSWPTIKINVFTGIIMFISALFCFYGLLCLFFIFCEKTIGPTVFKMYNWCQLNWNKSPQQWGKDEK